MSNVLDTGQAARGFCFVRDDYFSWYSLIQTKTWLFTVSNTFDGYLFIR